MRPVTTSAETAPRPSAASPPPRGAAPMLPHNLDAEASVLGSMLLSWVAIDEATEILRPEDFYRGAHRTLFEAITALHDAGEPADPVTVTDELARRGHLASVGGAVAVSDMCAFVPSAATAAHYARIVADCALRRRLLDAAGRIAGLVHDPPPGVAAEELADQAEALLHHTVSSRHDGEATDLRHLLYDELDRLEQLDGAGPVTGLSTGLGDLDPPGCSPPASCCWSPAPGSARAPSPSASPPTPPCASAGRSRCSRWRCRRPRSSSASSPPRRACRSRGCAPASSPTTTGRPCRPPSPASPTRRCTSTTAPASTPAACAPAPAGCSAAAASRSSSWTTCSCSPHPAAWTPTPASSPRSPAASSCSPRSSPCPSWRCRSCRAAPRSAPTAARSWPTSGSGGLEQDADLVWLLYRDDAYQPAPGPTGPAELAVAKHRNGPVGTVPLTFHADRSHFTSACTRQESL